jgi:hypothetical protein
MGGNALKKIKVDRIKTENMNSLRRDVYDKLKTLGSDIKVGFPQFYFSKQDHGDLDVVIGSDLNWKTQNFKNLILNMFESKDHYFNSNVFSIEYKNHQIDLIFTEPKYFQSYINYFSFNDLGNFIGRTAHKMGFKYGERGLLLNVVIEGRNLGEIELSQDTELIFEFLGYDYERWTKGFDKLEEVFDFVISSKYFSGTAFSNEEQNNTNRTRNEKRPNWNLFKDFLDLKGLLEQSYPFQIKEFYLYEALEFFDKRQEFNKLLVEDHLNEQRKSKYNGKIIIELTGLEGKSIGEFKNLFEKSKEDWCKWLDSKTEQEVRNEILDFYSNNFKS